MGLSGDSQVMFYPSGMTALYDTFTPAPFWANDVINFETNCDVAQRDVYVWNMNIPWTESPAGLFSNTYEDFNKFKSDVESIGIPVDIAIRQLYTESAFSPDIMGCKRRSSAGAMGIAQFMPVTWPSYGKGGDPCKVSDALPAYVKLMSELVNKFNGRLDLAMAGYNGGPNRSALRDAVKNNTPFTELKGKIPEESYKYSLAILQP
jgi:soluble lytic murein transglycosylase-like protein